MRILKAALACLCFVIAMPLWAESLPSVTYQYSLGQTTLTGTASDPDHPSRVRIGTWVNGTSTGSIFTVNGQFTYTIPAAYRDGQNHSLMLYAVDIKSDGSAPGNPYRTVGPITIRAYPKPTVSLSWNPANVAYNGSSTLSWSSTNATSCVLNGQNKPTNGSWIGTNRVETRTDSIYCDGPGGRSTTATSTLTVESLSPVSISGPSNVVQGNQFNLSISAVSGANRYELFKNNTLLKSLTSSGTVSWRELSTGQVTFKVRACAQICGPFGNSVNVSISALPSFVSLQTLQYVPNPVFVGDGQYFSFEYKNVQQCMAEARYNDKLTTDIVYIPKQLDANGVALIKSGIYRWPSSGTTLRDKAESWVQSVTCIDINGNSRRLSVVNNVQARAVHLEGLKYVPNPVSVGQEQYFTFQYKNVKTCYADADLNAKVNTNIVYVPQQLDATNNPIAQTGIYRWPATGGLEELLQKSGIKL